MNRMLIELLISQRSTDGAEDVGSIVRDVIGEKGGDAGPAPGIGAEEEEVSRVCVCGYG